MFVICGGNLLVMMVFGGHQRLRQPKNFYVVQLAIADFTVGLCMPYHAATFLYPKMLRNIHVCLLRYSSSMFGMFISVLSLVSLTVDRFSAMNWPLTYQQTLSSRRQVAIALVIWFTSLCCVFTPVMTVHNSWSKTLIGDCDLVMVVNNKFLYLILPIFFGTSASVILVLYARILFIAYRHMKAIQTLDIGRDINSQKTEFRAAKTTAFVLGIFYGCWGPFTTWTVLQIALNKHSDQTWTSIRSILSIIAISNSAMNPFIYAYKMPEVREKFKQMLKFKRAKIEQSTITVSTVYTS